MKKWDDNYSRVFGCKANTTPVPLLAAAPSSAAQTTASPSTAPSSTAITAPEIECGCYAEDEEITISNDNCILDLGTAPDVAGTWSFTFETKLDSKSDGKFLYKPRSVISGIGYSLKFTLNKSTERQIRTKTKLQT